MNTALIIASRELRDRSRLFLVALILAVVPFLIALLPGARSDRPTTIAMGGGTFAVALGFATAIALGASIVGRELAEKRLSFLFSKPVSPASIWFGKVMAALATSLGCFLIIIVPTYLVSRGVWLTTTLHWAAAISIVFLFFISHAIATMVRSRSVLIGLDFLLALGTAAAIYLIVRPLLIGGAVDELRWVLGGIAAALLVILAVAPVAQLALGRTDVRRNHFALSRALWIPVVIVLAIAAAYVASLIRISPEEMRVFSLVQSPSNNSVVVSGSALSHEDYVGTLLVDAASGKYERLPTPPWWGTDLSRDGRTLAWMQPTIGWDREMELYTRRLDIAGAKNVATGIMIGGNPSLVLSDDGARVAIGSGGNVVVYELASGKMLASASGFEQRAGRFMYFATPDVVRIIAYTSIRNAGPVPITISELDVAHRKLTQTASIAAQSGHSPVGVSADGSRMFIRRDGLVVDARTGATLAKVPPADSVYASAILHGGSVAAVSRDSSAARLHIYDAAGALTHELQLPGAKMAWITGETTDGNVILLGFGEGREPGGRGRTMFLVDPARGAIVRAAKDVKGPLPQWTADPRLPQFRAGMKLAAVDANGKITEW